MLVQLYFGIWEGLALSKKLFGLGVLFLCVVGAVVYTFSEEHQLLKSEVKAWQSLCRTYRMAGCEKREHWKNPCLSPYVDCKFYKERSVVSHLQLIGRGTYAPMSRALLQFKQLDSMDAEKVFRGRLPEWIGQLPPKFHNLTINKNRLEGPIPATLARLKSLEKFEAFEQCAYAQKPRVNPHDSGQPCRRMFRVKWDGAENEEPDDWSCGGFSGPLPASIQTMHKLKRFWVDESRLSGPLPGWFARMKSLEELDLFGNPYTGGIPKEWTRAGAFPRLRILQIGGSRVKAKASDLNKMLKHIPRLRVLNVRDLSLHSPESFVDTYTRLGFLPKGHPRVAYKKKHRRW